MRYAAPDLVGYGAALLERSGLVSPHAWHAADILVEADLLGHASHGLFQLPRWLADLEHGAITQHGAPDTIVDAGARVVWEGRGLPGASLLVQAIDLGLARLAQTGVFIAVIRNGYHFGCLSAYLRRATERNVLIQLACSSHVAQTVAPFGGIDGVFGTSPLAMGIPTEAAPILIDVSTASTSHNRCRRLHQDGERLPGPWLLDAQGHPTDDPAALFAAPHGTILPLGGADLGYKGYGLALMVQALTHALGGQDRAAAAGRRRQGMFLLLIDPDAFGGRDQFMQETGWLADACRASAPVPGGPGVRLPGQQALARRAEHLARGIPLHPATVATLAPWSERLDVAWPAPLVSTNATLP